MSDHCYSFRVTLGEPTDTTIRQPRPLQDPTHWPAKKQHVHVLCVDCDTVLLDEPKIDYNGHSNIRGAAQAAIKRHRVPEVKIEWVDA